MIAEPAATHSGNDLVFGPARPSWRSRQRVARGASPTADRRRSVARASSSGIAYSIGSLLCRHAAFALTAIFAVGLAIAVWVPFGDEAEAVAVQLREVGYVVDAVQLAQEGRARNDVQGAMDGRRVYRVLYRDESGVRREGYRVAGDAFAMVTFLPRGLSATTPPSNW